VPPTERDMLLVALRTARSRLRKGTKRLGIQDARALCDTYLRHYSFLFFDSLMFRLVVVVVCRFVRFFKQLMNNWRAYYKVRSIRFVSKSNIEDQSFNQSINTEPIFPPPPSLGRTIRRGRVRQDAARRLLADRSRHVLQPDVRSVRQSSVLAVRKLFCSCVCLSSVLCFAFQLLSLICVC
jgi:hypothetical protein